MQNSVNFSSVFSCLVDSQQHRFTLNADCDLHAIRDTYYRSVIGRIGDFTLGVIDDKSIPRLVRHSPTRAIRLSRRVLSRFEFPPSPNLFDLSPSKYNRCYEFKGDTIFTIRPLARCGRRYYYNAHIVPRVLMPRARTAAGTCQLLDNILFITSPTWSATTWPPPRAHVSEAPLRMCCAKTSRESKESESEKAGSTRPINWREGLPDTFICRHADPRRWFQRWLIVGSPW